MKETQHYKTVTGEELAADYIWRRDAIVYTRKLTLEDLEELEEFKLLQRYYVGRKIYYDRKEFDNAIKIWNRGSAGFAYFLLTNHIRNIRQVISLLDKQKKG